MRCLTVGHQHVRPRPGDDDFLAVELNLKLHDAPGQLSELSKKPRKGPITPGLLDFRDRLATKNVYGIAEPSIKLAAQIPVP